MDETTHPDDAAVEAAQEPIPIGQRLFDEIFLWFMLSLVISLLLFNVWGLMDLLRVPLAP